jgi:hypothetical protein
MALLSLSGKRLISVLSRILMDREALPASSIGWEEEALRDGRNLVRGKAREFHM